MLVFTNTDKVWRYHTRGDYWLLDVASNQLVQVGKDLPSLPLMYAKISPDGQMVAYVSGHNLYMAEIDSNEMTQLTQDGTRN